MNRSFDLPVYRLHFKNRFKNRTILQRLDNYTYNILEYTYI